MKKTTRGQKVKIIDFLSYGSIKVFWPLQSTLTLKFLFFLFILASHQSETFMRVLFAFELNPANQVFMRKKLQEESSLINTDMLSRIFTFPLNLL